MNKDFTTALIIRLCNIPRSKDYLIRHLAGIDPIAISSFLHELESQHKLSKHYERYWIAEEKTRITVSDIQDLDAPPFIKRYMGEFELFKKPHPLDFEWRNSPNTVRYLTEKVLNLAGNNMSILVLGMPTLFASLCDKSYSQHVAIVERNKAVTDILRVLAGKNNLVFEEDIFEVSAEKIGKYDIVIMDPPWYPIHFEQFVWLASQCLKICGKLLISIPSYNTRPGIMKERVNWITYSETLGLCIESLEKSTLEYWTPFFEYNAQRFAGINMNALWRRGDLLTFTKLENSVLNRRPIDIEFKKIWQETEIDGVRIRIDTSQGDEDDTLLIESMVPLDVLPSVSSRDTRRKSANVWTSGNRIFRTNKPIQLLHMLNLMRMGVSDSSLEFVTCSELFSVILDLEQKEYNSYIEWLYQQVETDFTQIFQI